MESVDESGYMLNAKRYLWRFRSLEDAIVVEKLVMATGKVTRLAQDEFMSNDCSDTPCTPLWFAPCKDICVVLAS